MSAKGVSGTPSSMSEGLKKATTEMLVLCLLRQKPMYTYEMMTSIEVMSGGEITFNTLYQAIYRLQNFRYIREEKKVLSVKNRTRVYFSITETGQAHLSSLVQEYHRVTRAVDKILCMVEETGNEG